MKLEELFVYILICFVGYHIGKLLLNCSCSCKEGIRPDGHRAAHSARCEGNDCETPSPPPPAPSPLPSPSPTTYWSCPGGNDTSKPKRFTTTNGCIKSLNNTYTRWSSKSECDNWCSKPNPPPSPSHPPPPPPPPKPSPSPSPPPPLDESNECDTMVAKQWKNLICEQIQDTNNPLKRKQNYDNLLGKVQKIMEKETPLHPLSFDPLDKEYVGCDKYDESPSWNNNYCIQVNQGTETCKPDHDSPKKRDAVTCEKLPKDSCSNGCAWRVPNLVDKYEELSVQIGTCPNKDPPPGSGSNLPVAFEPGECDPNKETNLRQCKVGKDAHGSFYGEITDAKDLIGKNPNELHRWCSPKYIDDLRPQKEIRRRPFK